MLDCRNIHFIGIGGVGMSALAWVLLRQGYRVTGSDIAENNLTRRLTEKGATIFIGHHENNVTDAELVIISSAIVRNNPEILAVKKRNVPVWHRSQLLAAILNAKRGIAVSGTHGKTTTTSMASFLLKEAGLDPTVLIGAELNDMGGNAANGYGDYVIAEADESDGSLLNLQPEIAVITNIEPEHLDFYRDIEHELDVFTQFAGQVKEDGTILCSLDDYGCCRILDCVNRSFMTFSVREPVADIYSADVILNPWSSEYMCIYRDTLLGRVQLSVPGLHNVSNSLAAIGIGLLAGVDFDTITRILPGFHGASRRFDIKGKAWGVSVVDDYAHHPTEIAATLSAARKVAAAQQGRVIALFQPHRYTRTAHLAEEFGAAFDNSDVVVITDVYPAGEKPIEGVSGELIFEHVKYNDHPAAIYCPAKNKIPEVVVPLIQENDVVLTLGAGDIWKSGESLLHALKTKEKEEIITI